MPGRRVVRATLRAMFAFMASAGCASTSVTELRGKTAFGPEFRNRGDNTSEIRYDARQALELRWDNGWTSGITYRRRDVDDGSGDSENLFLFEVGYPIWKAPKKPDKTALQIEELRKQLGELQSQVAGKTAPQARVARVGEAEDADPAYPFKKEDSHVQP